MNDAITLLQQWWADDTSLTVPGIDLRSNRLFETTCKIDYLDAHRLVLASIEQPPQIKTIDLTAVGLAISNGGVSITGPDGRPNYIYVKSPA